MYYIISKGVTYMPRFVHLTGKNRYGTKIFGRWPQLTLQISNHARFLGWFLHVFTLHAKCQLLHAEITDKSKSVLWAICWLIGFASESRRIHHGVLSVRMFFQISGFIVLKSELKCFAFLQNSEKFPISAADLLKN